MEWSGRRLHLVGIGGAGMSGYALVAAQLGATVSGSDRADSPVLARLRAAVITNVELDHHAAYGSLEELRDAYRAFLAGAPEAVIWDHRDLIALRDGPVVPYDALGVVLTDGGSRFRWRGHEVELRVPGAHNAINAAGALEACALAGADPAAAASALADFAGAGRRFERLGTTASGALVVDDYAHHPTEVAATIDAARTLDRAGRVWAGFQPPLFSRTALLAREFGAALARADVVALLDVYPARERAEDFPGVSGLLLAETTADAAPGKPVFWLPTFADARRVLAPRLRRGDVVLVLGAGDVDRLGRVLVEG